MRCNRNSFSEQPGASMMPRCRGLSGTSLVTLLVSMFVYNLSIMLDIVSGLQLFSSSRSVVSFGSNIDIIIFYLIGHFSRVQPYIIDVACHGKLWVQFFQLF
jgi:hypothetical protein